MENTGRITRGLTPSARRIIFGATADASIDAELEPITRIDQAHLLMLGKTGIIPDERIAALLAAIRELRASGFQALRGRPAIRGVYLLYENHLIEKLGADTGGILQTGRSRNDLNATVLKLRMRRPWAALLREMLRLSAVLLSRARRFADVVMPAYTHTQAAVPITYGHYLAGIATALLRDTQALLELRGHLSVCPLGAGSVGGTSFPIDTTLTATLLGFDRAAVHSIDAVASRDLVLRLLGSATVFGVTLSRLAADYQQWATAEFGFLTFPETLVGSSSMMPQKRNPFLLEHIQGRSAAALGGFVRSANSMQATHFTNTIAVGTEAVSFVWSILDDLIKATTLARLCVAGAKPEPQAMLTSAESGYTTATELANRLVRAGVPFRQAHHEVGALVRKGLDAHAPSLAAAIQTATALPVPAHELTGLDAASVARASEFGGGAGPESMLSILAQLHFTWQAQVRERASVLSSWRAAEARLDDAVSRATA